MSCGLGATVLLFLIVRHNFDPLTTVPTDLRSETNLLAEEIQAGEENLLAIRNSLREVNDELAVAEGLADRIQSEIDALMESIAQLDPEASAGLDALQQRIAELEAQRDLLRQAGGSQVRQFVGDGQRQYLSGLNMGGRFNLILLDVSASMLDSTLVNILRRRNMDEATMRSAAKWQQGLSIAEWLVANLTPDTAYQVMLMSETTRPALPASNAEWLSTSDLSQLDQVIDSMRDTTPAGGTSLHRAFAAANQLSPRPDNIFLITDGLPTIGAEVPSANTVSSDRRITLFNQAVDQLPRGVPVNTMLLPLEGDAWAAGAYWRLAVQTGGAFLTPTGDWP